MKLANQFTKHEEAEEDSMYAMLHDHQCIDSSKPKGDDNEKSNN